MTRLYPIPLLASLLLVALPLSAQPARDGVQRDMDRLRAENAVLRRELKAIKAIVDGVQTKLKAAQKTAGKGAPELKVGVVDLGKVFLASKRKAVLEEQINAARKELKARARLNATKLEDLETLNEKLDPAERAAVRTSYENQRYLHRQRQEALEEEMRTVLKARAESMTLSILTDIERAVAKYGAAEGYDLIFKTDSGRHAKGQAPAASEAIFRSQVNTVLYRDQALDVTDAVIKILNGPQAEWFEPGHLAKVVYLLEVAGVSYAGKRLGPDLVIECMIAGGSLSAIADVRKSLQAEHVARHFRAMEKTNKVEVRAGDRMHFKIRLQGWSGGGAEEFYSLDRVIEFDTSGSLGRLVKKLESAGLQVQGRAGNQLHLTILGTPELVQGVANGDLARSERAALGLRTSTIQKESPTATRLELKAPKIRGPRGDLSHVKVGQVYVYEMDASGTKIVVSYVVQRVNDSSVTYVTETIVAGRKTTTPAMTWKIPKAKDAPAPGTKTRFEAYEFAGKSWETRVVEGKGTTTWIPLKGGSPTFPPFFKSEGPNSKITIVEIKNPRK